MRRGLSLVEILIASTIMVAAMVPLWGLLGSSHQQVTISADEVRASQMANEIIEQIENSNWFPDPGEINFTPVKDSMITVGTSKKVKIAIGDFPDYFKPDCRLEIEKYPASGDAYGRIVRLKVNYNAKDKVGNEVNTYQISTFIARK
ncbi:MAG: hypothetical protein PWR01_4085 [Clostridiales bacterium]|nr:hypothetical protein [Clostridiales bacterium]MDN5283012.1 hypothetical protein [Candidatus Ozemobacter sp.]